MNKHIFYQCRKLIDKVTNFIVFFLQTGMTALHVAASCGQTEFVQEMLTQIPATIPSERPGDTSLSDDVRI